MAQHSYDRSDLPRIDGARVAVIQAAWHKDITDLMVQRCSECLVSHGAESPQLHLLPGSLELPLAAQRIARRDRTIEAIVAFGIILKGETDHYDVVRLECMRGLTQVMLNEDIPILIEVLPVLKLEHAAARGADNEHNKGLEAAHAAIEVIDWRRRNPATPAR